MNNFDFSIYDPVDTTPSIQKSKNKSKESSSKKSEFDFNIYETPIVEKKQLEEKFPEEGFLKSSLRLATQIPQGLSEGTTPGILSNLIPLIGMGESLNSEEIEHIRKISEREGIPFDEEKYLEAVRGATEAFPNISNIAKGIESKIGIPLEPKTKEQHMLRFLSSLGKSEAKIPKLTHESQSLKEIAEQFNLRKFSGMEAEKSPLLTPIISAEKEAQLVKELSESSKQAIDKIIEKKIPIKEMQKMGINLEDAYQTAYSATRKTASQMGNKSIDYSNIPDWIDKQIKITKKSAPSLSSQQKTYIDILTKEKNNFIEKDAGINLITGKKMPPFLKPMNAEQGLNQYRNFNDNVKSIWRKPEFSGSENSVKNAYAGLNEQLINAIEKANPQLGKELKFANNIFHETSKLDQVSGILEKSFKNGYNANKLSKTLSNRRERKFLERNIGKDGVQDLERIAKYGQIAEKKIFDQIKNPKTAKEYLENLTPMNLALLVGYKSHVALPFYLSKHGLQRLQGYLFTRDPTRKSFIDFLKKASEVAKSPITLYNSSRHLSKSINEEFGSEKDLLNMINQQE